MDLDNAVTADSHRGDASALLSPVGRETRLWVCAMRAAGMTQAVTDEG